MTKFYTVLFMFILFLTVKAEKEESKSDEIADSTENITDDHIENDSASIQIVHKDASDEKTAEPLNYDIIQEEDNRSGGIEDTVNSTQTVPKFEQFFEDILSDSDESVPKASPEIKHKETEPSDAREDENDYSKRQEEIEIVYEHITQAQTPDEEDLGVNEEENNWRSAENLHDVHKDFSNEGISLEADEEGFSGEDYGDKKITSVKGRMETPEPRRKEHIPMNMRRYGPHDDGSMLDAVSMRGLSEIVVPRYRPTLTRNGIVYTPTLYTVQTASPLLERLPNRGWMTNRGQFNPEREVYSRQRSKGVPHVYETESKMIDDYNDYGTNTYSYTPAMKRTTQAPPTQAMPPNKFDVFQKLVEASNQPSLSKRPFNDNMFAGNYYQQRQFTDSYGPYDVRRLRRDTWEELPFPDI